MIIENVQQGSAEWHRMRCGVVTASDAGMLLQPGPPPRAPRCFSLTDAGLAARLRGSVQMQVQAALAEPWRASPSSARGETMALDERQIPGGVSRTLLQMVERGHVVEVEPPADVEPLRSPLVPSAQRGRYMHRLLAEWVLQRPVDAFQGTYWTERGHRGEGDAADAFESITGMRPRAVGFIWRDDTRTAGCSPDWVVGDGDIITATAEVKNLAEDNHVATLLGGELPRTHLPQVQFQTWVTGRPAWFMSACPPEESDGVVRLPPLILRVDPDPHWHAAFDQHVPAFIEEMMEARARLVDMGAVPVVSGRVVERESEAKAAPTEILWSDPSAEHHANDGWD